jgi:probable F420-dependent oxidoreductase
MHLGLAVPNSGPHAYENVRTLPSFYEELGYHSAWFVDHVVGVRSFEPVYPMAWVEALTSLSYAAACTERIRLGVGVLVAPYRDPVMAAKTLVTLDGLSQGRLDIGIGAGWARSEFHALGAGERFETRSRYTDEAIEVIARCFEGGEFGWDGEWVKFRRMTAEPRPVQQPHPPFWIGGMAGPALRRAIRWADAWHPTRLSPEDVAKTGAELDRRAGRSIPRTVRIRVPLDRDLDELVEELQRYEAAGCVEVVIEIYTLDPAELRPWAQRLAAAVGIS